MHAPFTTTAAPRGMVCAVDHLAAAAGADLLRRGGSAADAAVGANAVLAVTSQHLCGMGGDLFALVHDGTTAAPAALVSSGRAGSGADPERLRAEGHTAMPPIGDVRVTPVPGCVDGWLALHQRYGWLPLADVFAAARSYAADGFPASVTLAGAVSTLPDPGDFAGVRRPGDTVRRPGVARALDAIVDRGRAGFYEGEFGDGLLRLGNGEYEPVDLVRPAAEWVDAVGLDAFGRRIWTTPPPSQGYLTPAAAWMAEGLDLPADPDDPQWAHLLIESARQAAYDRIDVLHEHADAGELLAPERLAPRRAAVNPHHAAVLGDRYAAGGTTYVCAVDADRVGVSLIQSNAAGFGSTLFEPSTGIFLQNRGIGFSLQPGHPAEYGPGRRPPHTLSPALVTFPDRRLAAVLGTMGGDSQPQILLQLLARLFHSGQSPADAIAAGRWRLASEGPFDTWRRRGHVAVHIEGHAPPWRTGLVERGHVVEGEPSFSHAFGHAHVITVGDDHVAGAADPRARGGGAAGW